jgi:hypothetical protein
MDLFGRLSAAEYRSLAARWRRLAIDATTPQTRDHLLGLVRQCEFLAGGDDTPAVAGDDGEGAEPRDASP